MVPTISSESPISLAALSTSPTECSIWIGIFLKRYFNLGFKRLFMMEKCVHFEICALVVVFRQIEIVLKDSTAFVYVMKSEKSSY